jgi:hypothetical protein
MGKGKKREKQRELSTETETISRDLSSLGQSLNACASGLTDMHEGQLWINRANTLLRDKTSIELNKLLKSDL